jgi:UDP-N-acetylglucosamine 2-epimerase
LPGALVASKLHIPVAHVEAGLRSFNKSMPEEINRILTDHCSDLLFAPTETAVKNLDNEGLKEKTFLTGDIMLDTLQLGTRKADQQSEILVQLQLDPGNYHLMTLRPETEWLETVEAGWNKVIGNDASGLLDAINYFNPSSERPAVFGTYSVAEKMIKEIVSYLN